MGSGLEGNVDLCVSGRFGEVDARFVVDEDSVVSRMPLYFGLGVIVDRGIWLLNFSSNMIYLTFTEDGLANRLTSSLSVVSSSILDDSLHRSCSTSKKCSCQFRD
jgi:hypothetical protein